MISSQNDVFIALFPCWNKKLDCKTNASWSKNELTAITLIKVKVYLPISCSETDFFWIAFTVTMLKLLNSHIVVFRQYQKRHFILHIAFISRVASSNKCSELNFISLFNFFLKHKALYKENFLEHAFQIKI